MSQALSNANYSFLPISSGTIKNQPKSLCSWGSPNTFKTIAGGDFKLAKNRVKTMAGDFRDNLDHLQRPTKHQQAPSKKRVAPTPPGGLWDRFPTASTVQQMMERMMDYPFAYSGTWPSPLRSETNGYSRGRTPWEIKEGETEYKMRFDMPGMTKEDVKVWVEEKMLVVKAEKVFKENEEEKEEWSAKSYGKYRSRIALPESIEFENIKAEVKDGVLFITIPKATGSSKVFDINVH